MSVGVIGAGTMGGGIAMNFANAPEMPVSPMGDLPDGAKSE